MRVRDLNWMQLEAYLSGDDRIVLPVGSTEQHAYLSLETDNILAERASVEAADAARGPGAAGAAIRRDRLRLHRVPRQPHAPGVHAGLGPLGYRRLAGWPGVRADPRGKRSWRKHRVRQRVDTKPTRRGGGLA